MMVDKGRAHDEVPKLGEYKNWKNSNTRETRIPYASEAITCLINTAEWIQEQQTTRRWSF